MMPRGITKFCRDNNIELLVLFGSAAGDRAEGARDVDIAIKPIDGTTASKLELIYKLEVFFKEKQIDIVVLSADTDPLLLHEIFKGQCLYEKKKGLFKHEKLRAWKLYLDTKKIRNLRNQYLKVFARKASHVA